MSISRRLFLRIGTFAAIAAGISIRPNLVALGRGTTERLGLPATNDPLSYYTMATFLQYVNSVFLLRSSNTSVEVALTSVQDTLPAEVSRAGGRESFVLEFRGDAGLPQNTYVVDHAALGTFRLFLVPGGPDENGSQGYAATINRLGYVTKPDRLDKPRPLKSSPTRGAGDIGAPALSKANSKPEVRLTRKTRSESKFRFN